MPNFFVFVRSFPLLPRRIALFATLLIAALALSVYQVPQPPEYSQVIYSQDISLITELPTHRHSLDYLLLAQPLADFPHYIIKYKGQTKLALLMKTQMHWIQNQYVDFDFLQKIECRLYLAMLSRCNRYCLEGHVAPSMECVSWSAVVNRLVIANISHRRAAIQKQSLRLAG